ncbi:MAG: prephenate dehydrogenase/arogenate dehydrogenase family protein [Verrucomicrobiota bacterium]
MNTPAKITIFGPGLMGSSLCLAIREAYPETHIAVWARNRDRLAKVEAKGLADSTSIRPDEVAKDADLIVLCVPITAMQSLVEDFLEVVKKECLITDVGSVKSCVDHKLAPLIDKRARWIGSHPMTGSEKSGLEAAQANLYQETCTIITPTEATNSQTVKDITEFWSKLGSSVHAMTPNEHDLSVAAISHVPHIVAAALVNGTAETALKVSGPGFRDTTRVAAGSAELWNGILSENRTAVLRSMQQFIDELGTVRDLLKNEDSAGLTAFLEKASSTRTQITSS